MDDRSRDHDIVEWVASMEVEVGGAAQGVRLVLGFTPEELVVAIDCTRVGTNLIAKLLPVAEPVPLVGDGDVNPLGIMVSPGIKEVATSLPLNTLIDLVEAASLLTPTSSPSRPSKANSLDAGGGVPAIVRRSIVFVGHSLSGCVAHAAALLVNVGKPVGHDDRPLARSVAFSAPPCFTVGSGATKKAKTLMLQMVSA